MFLFSADSWSVLDKNTGVEIQTMTNLATQKVSGIRSGGISGGSVMLPIKASDGLRGEIIIFGGDFDSVNKVKNII